MAKTYQNQKWICVHKNSVRENFLQIYNPEWMEANKRLSPYGLQLYLYLASNCNNYQFALSPASAEEYAGIKKTSFHKYMRLLEIEGYIVWRHGNVYDFYTTPRDEAERSHPDQHSDCINFDVISSPDELLSAIQEDIESVSQTDASPDETSISFYDQFVPPLDKEIDNRDIDNNRIAGKPRTPASPDADASASHSKEENRQVRFVF